jgi:uncharacterized protein (DUF4415 family)
MSVKRTNKPSLSATDIERLKSLAVMRDSGIDYSDNPATDEAFWADAVVIRRGPKEQISIRLDADLLEWFRKRERYQTEINEVPRTFIEHHR